MAAKKTTTKAIKNNEKPKRARITLECSLELRKAIRIRAAQEDRSMNDLILSMIEEKLASKKN